MTPSGTLVVVSWGSTQISAPHGNSHLRVYSRWEASLSAEMSTETERVSPRGGGSLMRSCEERPIQGSLLIADTSVADRKAMSIACRRCHTSRAACFLVGPNLSGGGLVQLPLRLDGCIEWQVVHGRPRIGGSGKVWRSIRIVNCRLQLLLIDVPGRSEVGHLQSTAGGEGRHGQRNQRQSAAVPVALHFISQPELR